MNIFIDESGIFKPEGEPGAPSFDCVAAIILNDLATKRWVTKYGALSKGRRSNEEKAQEILKFLDENNAKAFTISVETNRKSYSKSCITEHQKIFVSSMDTATKGHPENLRLSVFEHMKHLEGMNCQQYVKVLMITRVIENAVRGILSQASKYTIKDFLYNTLQCDTVDKKTKSTIKHLVHLAFNCSSRREPLKCDDLNKIRDFTSADEKIFNFYKFIGNTNFKSDEECIEIKAADCIANFFRRLLRRRLMLHNRSNFASILSLPYSIDFLHFDNKQFIDCKLEDEFVISVLKDFGIPLI
jgi:hypothetical protein